MSDLDSRNRQAAHTAAYSPGAVEAESDDDAAILAELREADGYRADATEHALLDAGLDPADPWAVERDATGAPPSAAPVSVDPTVTIPEFDPDARGDGYVYLRLADHLTARIKARDLEPGTRLPAERDLAMQYGVSIGTIRRVAAELRDRQLIRTLPAKGTYVRR